VKRATIVAIVASLLLVTTLGTYMVLEPATATRLRTDAQSQYVLEDAAFLTNFVAPVKDLKIDDRGTATWMDFGPDGLSFSFPTTRDRLRMSGKMDADTVALSMDFGDAMEKRSGSVWVEMVFEVAPHSEYKIYYRMNHFFSNITYTAQFGDDRTVRYGDLLLDHSERLEILFHIESGITVTGVNGIEHRCTMPSPKSWSPRFVSVTMGPGNSASLDRKIVARSLQMSEGLIYHFQDGLHKTIVPDGMDFAFSIHSHADRAYPQYFQAMADLSREYGLSGTYDAWLHGSEISYGMDDANYTAALHELQDSGWDIGLHAISPTNENRSNVIAGIENFTAEFGTPRTWSDHGHRLQDLVENGTNTSSVYYDEDLIEAIGAAWWNDPSHSHASVLDLNLVGMNYTLPGHEDIPSFRVTPEPAYKMFYRPGRSDDVGSYLRGLPVDRSVIVTHDYLPYFFYVSAPNGSLTVLPSNGDLTNYPWTALEPKNVFSDAEWHPLPQFLDFLNWTQGYKVWFAPVRDIYDRSCVVQDIEVEENGTEVRINNPTGHTLSGLTLFTRSMPDYKLVGKGLSHTASKGTASSWHFIVDLGPHSVLVLKKVSLRTSRANGADDVPPQYGLFVDIMMAVDRTRG
jgi:hypothetical protein